MTTQPDATRRDSVERGAAPFPVAQLPLSTFAAHGNKLEERKGGGDEEKKHSTATFYGNGVHSLFTMYTRRFAEYPAGNSFMEMCIHCW